MGVIYQQFQQARGGTRQVFSYLDMAEEEHDAPNARPLPAFSRKIVFDRISFSYDATPVLREINLEERKGAVIALVGSSRGGNTTLVTLIPRFYDRTSALIPIYGMDVRIVTIHSLLQQIA